MALIKMASVEEEYQKNKELRKTDIEALKEWLKKQPHLPEISDYELIVFFHSNYYRMEPTKATIDTYYTVRTHVPDFFTNRDPLGSKDLRGIMKVVNYALLPGKTREGYQVVFCQIVESDPSKYVFADTLKFFIMTMDLALLLDGTYPGHIILFDMKGVVFGHVARLNPMAMKKFLYYLQEALPIRLKGLHFMNAVPFIDVIMNMMRPFMKKELLDMFVIHTELESLSKYVPIDILPQEQGGKAGPLKDFHDVNVKRLEEHRAWFQDDEVRGRVNESLRTGKAKNATSLFGVEGSFKKLDID